MKDICFCDMFQNFQMHFQAHAVCVTIFSFTSMINWYFSYTKWVSRNETPFWITVLMRNQGSAYDGSLFDSSRNEAGSGRGVHRILFLTLERFFLLIPNAHKSRTKVQLLHRRHRIWWQTSTTFNSGSVLSYIHNANLLHFSLTVFKT